MSNNWEACAFSLALQLVVDTSTLFSFHPMMSGDDSTVNFDLIPSGETVPREVAFDQGTSLNTPDRVARQIDSGLEPFPANHSFPHRE